MSVRYRLDLAYDGADFHGWAAQDGHRTVQGVLEHWIATVLRLGSPATLTVAGRTDAGVHARGQVAHVDLPEPGLAPVLQRRLERVLPGDVVVRRVAPAPAGFDARFAALWRRYVFRLTDGTVDPLVRRSVVGVRGTLDADALDAAARGLVGLHDFAAYCKPREGATTIRHLRAFSWAQEGPLLTASLTADAFCHSMVRALVGCLLAVGEGRHDPDWPADVLARRTRDPRVAVVHAHGLTLEEVGYPADEELTAQAERARARREELA